jgi:hypothetical protein
VTIIIRNIPTYPTNPVLHVTFNRFLSDVRPVHPSHSHISNMKQIHVQLVKVRRWSLQVNLLRIGGYVLVYSGKGSLGM